MARELRGGALAAAAALLLFATGGGATPVYVFSDALASGWTGAGYAPASGTFNLSAGWAHAGSSRAIRATLSPYGTFVLRAPGRYVSSVAAMAVLHLAVPPSSSAAPRAPLALAISIATWLPGGTSAPVAALCSLSQAASGGALEALPAIRSSPADAGCVAGPPDSEGWVRVSLPLDAFASAGWDSLQLSDTSGRGADLSVDDVVLLTAADLSAKAAWSANAGWCLESLNNIIFECTVPPSDTCCAFYGEFNAQGCNCVEEVRQTGGADLQLAGTLLGRRDNCATRLVLEDSLQCYTPPLLSAAGGSGTPPLPAAPSPGITGKLASPPLRPALSVAQRARVAAPYAGIVGVTALATAAAQRLIARRVERMLRLGTAEEGGALDERLLKPLIAS